MIRRKIIDIDEAKCNGCGQCVPACAEGALRIIDGKAKLVADIFCDGLGACLGECPQGAIRMIEREAEPFDEALLDAPAEIPQIALSTLPVMPPHSVCPGTAIKSFMPPSAQNTPVLLSEGPSAQEPSKLANWPVQLHLVPPHAPFLQAADLLLAADCVPAAMPDFHRRFLRGQPLLIGCPKLDDVRAYVEKLAAILRVAAPRSLTVIHMEVPCCLGLLRIAAEAKNLAGSDIPLNETIVSLRGEVLKFAEPVN